MDLRIKQAEKYHSNNSAQTGDADYVLQKFKLKIKWDSKKKIIDIGCGPGDITYNFLFPLISNDAEMLGIDISEPMIQFANSNYKDSRLNFKAVDILDPKFVKKYSSNFDMACSFHCFHWIHDQRSLMKNLFSILKPGGEILSIHVVDAINYRLYDVLGKSAKWSPYMKNYKNLMPPHGNSADPVSDFRNLMQDVKFHVKKCSLVPRSHVFSSKHALHDWMEAINPFSEKIPKHLANEYQREWQNIILDKKFYTCHEATQEVTLTYLNLIVFAQKPY